MPRDVDDEDPDEDRIERAGRRTGRALGYAAVPVLVILLGRQLGWW